MDIQDYFKKLNSESQLVFSRSMAEKGKLGSLHHLSSCIYEFSSFVIDPQERGMLETVCAQLESATFSMMLGLYRQAFSSLRLALELGLGAIYFSSNKVELNEWLDGRIDIKWSRLVDENNGVLSKRFINAFFADLADQSDTYRANSIAVYRKLSEYVHGNNETWIHSGIKVSYKEELLNNYCSYYSRVCEVILFSAFCRYAKYFDEPARDTLAFLADELNQLLVVRQFFGRT